jgi:hypothetical protein
VADRHGSTVGDQTSSREVCEESTSGSANAMTSQRRQPAAGGRANGSATVATSPVCRLRWPRRPAGALDPLGDRVHRGPRSRRRAGPHAAASAGDHAHRRGDPGPGDLELASTNAVVRQLVRRRESRRVAFRAVRRRSRRSATISRTWVSNCGPTSPIGSAGRSTAIARMCWHCAAEDRHESQLDVIATPHRATRPSPSSGAASCSPIF